MPDALVKWSDVAKALEPFDSSIKDAVAKVAQGGAVTIPDDSTATITATANTGDKIITSLPIPAADKKTLLDVVKDTSTFVIKHEGTPFTLLTAAGLVGLFVLNGLHINVPTYLVALVTGTAGVGGISVVKGKSNAG